MIYVLNMDGDIIDICSDWDEFDDGYGNCDCVTATDNEQDLIGREWIGDNNDKSRTDL